MKLVLALLAASVVALAQGFPEIKDLDSVIVRFSTACLGTCPNYSLVVRGSGEVAYLGRDYVAVRGERTARVDQAVIDALLEELRRVNFFWLLEASLQFQESDETVSVTVGDQTKSVRNPAGSIRGVLDILKKIAEPWVRGA